MKIQSITLMPGLSNLRVTFQTTLSKMVGPKLGRLKASLAKIVVIRVNDRVLGIAYDVRMFAL